MPSPIPEPMTPRTNWIDVCSYVVSDLNITSFPVFLLTCSYRPLVQTLHPVLLCLLHLHHLLTYFHLLPPEYQLLQGRHLHYHLCTPRQPVPCPLIPQHPCLHLKALESSHSFSQSCYISYLASCKVTSGLNRGPRHYFPLRVLCFNHDGPKVQLCPSLKWYSIAGILFLLLIWAVN